MFRNYAPKAFFDIDELRQWAENKGPVVLDAKLEAFKKLPENKDWAHRLQNALKEHGINLRTSARLVWLDAEKSVPGIRLLVAPKIGSPELESGIYPFAELMARFVPRSCL